MDSYLIVEVVLFYLVIHTVQQILYHSSSVVHCKLWLDSRVTPCYTFLSFWVSWKHCAIIDIKTPPISILFPMPRPTSLQNFLECHQDNQQLKWDWGTCSQVIRHLETECQMALHHHTHLRQLPWFLLTSWYMLLQTLHIVITTKQQ